MRPFRYFNAKTVGEAVELLGRYQEKARIIAGGTDLIPSLKNDIFPEYPEVIINIKTVRGLDYIKEDDEGLRIGPLTTLDRIAKSPLIRNGYRIISEASESVGSPQIRRMGTIGGNLCQDVRCWYYRYPHHAGGRMVCILKGGRKCYAVAGDSRYHSVFGHYNGCIAVNPSDMAVALLALDARARIAGSDGTKVVGMEDFFRSPNRNLAPDEILTDIIIPHISENAKQKFIKFRLRSSIDFSIAGVGIVTEIDNEICRNPRIVLGSVAPVPVRAKSGEEILDGSKIEEVAGEVSEASVSDAKPLKGNSYKIRIIKTLVKRALFSLSRDAQN